MRFDSLRSWDVALAVVGVGALLVEGIERATAGVWPGAYAFSLVAAAPLAWRRTSPLPAMFVAEAGAIACVLTFRASWAATGVVAVMLFTVALYGDRLRSVLVGFATAIGVTVTTVLIDGSPSLDDLAVRIGLVFLSLMLGDTLRTRRELRAANLEREVREAHEREQDSRRRVANERLRIARELHDTLAHALVAINVRAGVADHLGNTQNQAAALRDIKAVSATALGDLRTTLTLLRERDDAAPTRPALDLAALPNLTDNAREAGVRADLDVQVNGAAIPSAVGQAAYRIVQEALTNVLRHADASSAQVRIRATSDALEIEILDDGRSDPPTGGNGHGLRGMAERANALGGRVHAGPRSEGGWRVNAVLPLTGESTR
jgi:signal transduction histidine kinase